MEQAQKVGLAALLSILAALGSYVLTCTSHPGWGLLAAILSVPLGLVGLIAAASPKVRGGVISIFAMIFGAIAVIVSLLGTLGTTTIG